ncbi:MAG TPA: ATP-binding cassette domain-containing protein [Bauldia sp.]|nr:ATP-binding cassette domain-containing protein [Bauldia sp.]
MSAVSFDQVTLSLGGVRILADVGFDVGEGEFIGLLGPNGAGKTTLLRAIVGLIPTQSGRISVFGEPARRGLPGVAYLPQARGTLPTAPISGRDFIASAIHGERWGLPFASARDRNAVEEALLLVHGASLAARPLSRMSGGERQRLLIAGAIVGRPRLLLLDEPLISLDQHQQRIVVELVRELSRELKLTVLFSAHELNQLLGAVDRILYLGHGQAAIGTVDEVMNPATLTRLYGAPIDVVRVGGRIFVMSEGEHVEREHHHHDHGHA